MEVFSRCLFDLIVRTFRVSHLTLVLDDPGWAPWRPHPLAAVREDAIRQTIFACASRRRGSREIADTLAELFSTATQAA